MSASSINATLKLKVEEERVGGAQRLKVAGGSQSRLLCRRI